MRLIENAATLRAMLGEPSALVPYKIHAQLTAQARAYIAASPFLLLATADAKGMPTISPKGDGRGFVHLADARTLYLPERKGNRMLISLANVLENPKVGLIFLLPRCEETLRISGRASLVDDPALNQRLSARGSPALLCMRIEIEEVYFHCAKAFLRSGLWQPETWGEPLKISFGQEIALRKAMDTAAVNQLDSEIAARYKTDL